MFILIIPILTTPYLAKVLGPNGVGINAYTNSILQYFIIFGCLGTNIYANRKIAFVRENKYELSQTFWEILILRLFMLISSLLLFIMLILFFDRRFFAYYLAQSVTIVATIFDISWFFMGIERFSVTVLRNIIVKLASLVLIFSLVKDKSDLFVYILILSLSVLFGNLSMIPSIKGEISAPDLSNIDVFKHFMPSLILFIPEISTQIYLVLNKTMLGIIVSVQSSGFFDQSDKIIKIILAVVTATGTVMLPHVASAFSRGEIKKTKEYLYESFTMVTAMSVPMFFGLYVISSKLVPLFLSREFTPVTPILKVESIVIILIAWSNAIGVQYLLPTKQTKQYTISIILGAISNIILNIPFIILYGALGAAIATVSSELIVTIYQIWTIKDQISFRKLFNDVYKYFVSGILMFGIIYYVNLNLPISWGYLIIEILIGMILYILFIYLLKANIFYVIKKIRND